MNISTKKGVGFTDHKSTVLRRSRRTAGAADYRKPRKLDGFPYDGGTAVQIPVRGTVDDIRPASERAGCRSD